MHVLPTQGFRGELGPPGGDSFSPKIKKSLQTSPPKSCQRESCRGGCKAALITFLRDTTAEQWCGHSRGPRQNHGFLAARSSSNPRQVFTRLSSFSLITRYAQTWSPGSDIQKDSYCLLVCLSLPGGPTLI